MMSDKTVTIWNRWDDNRNAWIFNHIADGWSDAEKPEPKGEMQKKSWPSGKWQKCIGQLVNGVVKSEAAEIP